MARGWDWIAQTPRIGNLSSHHQGDFIKQPMEEDAQTIRHHMERVWIRDLHLDHLLGDWRSLWKRGRKDCTSQRGRKTTGKHDKLNQLNKTHVPRVRSNKHRGFHGSVPGPLHICYCYIAWCSCWTPNSGNKKCLWLLPALGTLFLLLGCLTQP